MMSEDHKLKFQLTIVMKPTLLHRRALLQGHFRGLEGLETYQISKLENVGRRCRKLQKASLNELDM